MCWNTAAVFPWIDWLIGWLFEGLILYIIRAPEPGVNGTAILHFGHGDSKVGGATAQPVQSMVVPAQRFWYKSRLICKEQYPNVGPRNPFSTP